MFQKIAFALLFAAGVFAEPLCAAPAIRIVKKINENPALYFAGISGDPALSQEIRSFLGACGWFDVVQDTKAEYNLSGRKENGALILEMTLGGVPSGNWRITPLNNPREAAKMAVDAIIEKTFHRLKVRGFCRSRIAFCARTASNVQNIYTCDIDGGAVQQITRYPTLCVEPGWTPSGNSICFSKYGVSGIDVIEMSVVHQNRARVLSSLRGINAGAAVSPDGRSLALILSPDHVVDLYVRPMYGRGMRRLTRGIAVEASPCWSPDGRQIAYVSDETGSPRIAVMSAGGGSVRRLPTIGADAVTPAWSKDNKIAYATRMGGQYTIAVYDLSSGENRRVVEEPGNWESPAWAPDGRQIVCKRSGSGQDALYVIDTWTGRTRRLLRTENRLSMPDWSPCKEK